ncbi:CAP domain-containing protein [Methanoregula sp. UBA64]|jgi:uncharacterized protein YkwD|uniref:CAP domain-containing protein n=1 Tax=Methanoregula sp. UBA64 TaxID=1915554 RepID=UPI0025DE6014|nr:CAP domain-containing protein [Methanoregula sp. UBA64]
MPRCDTCGKTVSLPFHCQYCGGNFCDEHRLPPNHACAGLAQWKKTPAPGVGIRYGSGGASAYGGGYANAPENRNARPSKKPLPYLKIAAVIVAAIVLLVIAFVLAGGCVQPANEGVAGSANATPASTAAEATVPGPTTTVTTTVTPSPTPTATTTKTRPNTGPTVSATQTTADGKTATAAATATLSVSGVSATPIPPPSVTPVPGKISEDPYTISTTGLAARVHELINSERQSYGLAPLAYDPALASIALSHSNDMALNNYFAHVNLAGKTPADRGNAAGYTCKKDYGSYYTIGIAENLFQNNLYTSVTETNGAYTYDWTAPEEIARSSVTGWMNSEGHRKNILTATYDREGIGVAIAADDKVYITENFC